MRPLTDFWLFIGDMFRHWVGAMTSVISVLLGFAPVFWPHFFSGHSGLLHARWAWLTASGLAFLIAAHSAWRQQKGKFVQAERLASDLRAQLDNRRPRIFFSTTAEPSSEWDSVAVFFLNHLGGDAAQYVRVDSIQCAKGTGLYLNFEETPHIDSHEPRVAVRFEYVVGGSDRSDSGRKLGFVFFQQDSKNLQKNVVFYPVLVRYKWQDTWLEERFQLKWNQSTQKLSVSDDPNLSSTNR